MLLRTTVVVGMLLSRSLAAQLPLDSVRAVAAIHEDVVRLGRRFGESIWPGYRPDTIPVAYVFPQGTALFNWRGTLPAGYEAIGGIPGVAWLSRQNISAANTGISLNGRNVAQVTVNSLRPELVLPLVFHEAMHAFEHSIQKPGMRFGHGENSFYVASYPIFDVRNESMWALEGRLLGEALSSTSTTEKRELARQFVAVRRQRQQYLGPNYAEFEQASELNEGIAEYALVRALRLLVADSTIDAVTRAGAAQTLAKRITDLATLTQNVTQSFRLRFYQTGPAQALLLDAIAGPAWKSKLMSENQSLQDALAEAVGLDDAQRAAFHVAVSRLDTTRAASEAAARVTSLVALRKHQVDSVLSAPGVVVELSAAELPGKDFNACGFDPQNHLQVSPTVQMQTRWWRPCGAGVSSEFSGASVHDDETGTVRA
ncbi:MAG TPA: hypothetical protein VJ852_15120, partial [Gemmatimonadaceae bacterium]|nr:hypothetical protein [Gemmatimonadaceae bacterium]